MAMNFLALTACVAAVYHSEERVVLNIRATPASPFVPGASCLVEGTADAGDAVYKAVRQVMVGASTSDELTDVSGFRSSSQNSKYDPATRRFSGSVSIPVGFRGDTIRVHAYAIDMAGREYQARGSSTVDYEDFIELPFD